MASGGSAESLHRQIIDDYSNVQYSALREKGFVLLGGRVCRIAEVSRSKTGKHGSCKVHIVALEVFGSRKRVTAAGSGDTAQVPVVQRRQVQLVSADDNGAVVLEADGRTNSVCASPGAGADELLRQMQRLLADGEAATVTVVAAMGEEFAVAVRKDKPPR